MSITHAWNVHTARTGRNGISYVWPKGNRLAWQFIISCVQRRRICLSCVFCFFLCVSVSFILAFNSFTKIVEFNSLDSVFPRHFEHFSWLWASFDDFCPDNTLNIHTDYIRCSESNLTETCFACERIAAFRKIDSYWHRCWKIC